MNNQTTNLTEAIRSIKDKYTQSTGILFDYNCAHSFKSIQQFSANECFNTKNKWMIFEEVDGINASLLFKQLSVTHLYVNAEIVYFNIEMGYFNESLK